MDGKGFIVIFHRYYFIGLIILIALFFGYEWLDNNGYIKDNSLFYKAGKLISLQPPNSTLIEEQIFIKTNEERIKYGFRVLALDKSLSFIAQEHSKDMRYRNFYDHINPDGDGPTERAEKYNIPIINNDWIGIGENIALIYVDNDADCKTNEEDVLGNCLVNKWMRSQKHKENILDINYEYLGVGVFCDTSKCWAVQNFR